MEDTVAALLVHNQHCRMKRTVDLFVSHWIFTAIRALSFCCVFWNWGFVVFFVRKLLSPTMWTESELGLFLQSGTVYITVHWELWHHRGSKLDLQSLYINWPRNRMEHSKPSVSEYTTERLTQNITEYSEQNVGIRTSPNLIHFKVNCAQFILQEWLWTSKAAKVTCSEFCSKTTELYSPTTWTQSEVGLFFP